MIENKRIVELPLNGRNYLRLVSLAPNVSTGFSSYGQAGARQGGIRAAQTISVAGQRTNFNHYTLDGVENTDPNFTANREKRTKLRMKQSCHACRWQRPYPGVGDCLMKEMIGS
ncbi:MAG TPA: hypothetical protein VKE70_32470 [Candidatus Solibacter sp.]|nr:hypothetical protein [Candidatus Solibacter sp.]